MSQLSVEQICGVHAISMDEPAAVLLVPPPATRAELVSSNQLRLVLLCSKDSKARHFMYQDVQKKN
jgi:hypothetical protein